MKSFRFSCLPAFLPAFLGFLPVLVNAQNIIRVSPVVNEGDYTSLQTAIDAAEPNDILMVYPGTYGSIQINKPLKIYGPGYRIPDNPPLEISTIKLNAQADDITFASGSTGSEFSGFYARRFIAQNVNNLTIKRNYFNHGGAGYNSALNNASSIIIEGNYFYIGVVGYYNECLTIGGGCQNVIIRNNVFNPYWGHTSFGVKMNENNGTNQIKYYNNYSNSKNTFHYSEIYNNIFTNPNGGSNWNTGGTNNYITNNMIGVQAGTFVSGTYSFDAQYQLAPNSPAKGAGVNGEDLGIFGGATPYKLSGIPDIPLVYELNVPGETPPGNVEINIKVRAEN